MRILGYVVFVLALLGCASQSLEVWHRAELDAEFTANKVDSIDSFERYLALEDTLFQQLDQQVYENVPAGESYRQLRYSSGSAADFRRRDPDWNRSRELTVPQPRGAALLLHGMSDSPYSLHAMAKRLQAESFHVLSLRLPGHGTAPAGLTRVQAEDMQAATALAMQHLASRFPEKPIHIVGYSTGAPLALNYALDAAQGKADRAPDSLVLISPAIGLHPTAALAAWKRRLGSVPGLSSLAWLSVEPEDDPYKYNSFATNAAEQVFRLTRGVSQRIAAWDGETPTHLLPPTLVLKSTVDATVSNQAVIDRLLRRLAPRRHELVIFDINRWEEKATYLVSEPGPLTGQLMDDASLPFAITLVTNKNEQSQQLVAQHKPSLSAEVGLVEELDMNWPPRVLSLSHVALPFAADDPLYGFFPPQDPDALFLGGSDLQGERGVTAQHVKTLSRIRSNPFYNYLETRTLDWISAAVMEQTE